MRSSGKLLDEFKRKCKLASNIDCIGFQEGKIIPYQLLAYSGEEEFEGEANCSIDKNQDLWYWVCGLTEGTDKIKINISAYSRNELILFQSLDNMGRVTLNDEFKTTLTFDTIYSKNESAPPPDRNKCIIQPKRSQKPNEQIITSSKIIMDSMPIENPEIIIYINL